jgi:hypothetical protein
MIFGAAENFIFRGVRQAATTVLANEAGSGVAPLPAWIYATR